ncbi:MAG: extracellular solute-binding protein, partial [Clostridia bacterium]|nr:extracellular solute-binding protein [Clostridia bacterium]
GPMENVGRTAEDIVYQLNYIYRKIIIVTGTEPDTYRDYELEKRVPGLIDMFNSVLGDLNAIEQEIMALNNGSMASANIITTLKMQLEDFIVKPYVIPDRLSVFKDNISALSTWMLDLRDQPVQIDKVIFTGTGAKEERQLANFWEGVAHEVRAFWSSFVDDYTAVGSQSSTGRSLTVWVGTGRDQAMVLKTLCDNYFTKETDISVNVSLVPLSILSKAIVANRGPDIALHVSRSEPMNLGVRNAVHDISQFEDFDEVSKRFTTYALTPYTLKTTDASGQQIEKVFALPETQNFDMLFYRTDIFAELGISVPETWDDLDNILPYIQANNMTVGLDTNLGGGTFFSMILQGGHTPYAEDGSVTNFTEQYAVNAFERWTRYYLQYDLPTDYNWYSRFRNGEMPLLSTSYSNITYLQESAPELTGLWDVAPIPGTKDPETGIVNHAEESTGMSGCMIVSKTIKTSKNPEQQLEDAWTFMKWWTSAEIAGEYGNRIEMAIGSVARYTTANVEAFEKIKWTTDEAAIIKEQREWVRENPELVGGYYVSRNIINAFRNVTNNLTNPREKLIYYNEQINDEIWRKRSEYNLSVPEEANK